QPVVIRLPSQSTATHVSLDIETRGPPLRAGSELAAPLLLSGLPYLSGDWQIWLPEEYTATGAGISNGAPQLNWRQRLFGFLGRPSGTHPFNPLRLVDGTAAVTEPPSEISNDQSQVTSLDRDRSTLLS